MKQLKYFLGGIIFYAVAIPVIESLAESAVTALELLKGKVSIPVLKMNQSIQKLQVDDEEISTNVIGFQIPSEEEWDNDDDDDFDDKLKHNKKKR
jgi:hypothetical protein